MTKPHPPTDREITAHEINHSLWISLKAREYTPAELSDNIGVGTEPIRQTLSDWERRGFVRRTRGFRYTSAIAMPVRKEGDRFVHIAHTPLIH